MPCGGPHTRDGTPTAPMSAEEALGPNEAGTHGLASSKQQALVSSDHRWGGNTGGAGLVVVVVLLLDLTSAQPMRRCQKSNI